MVITKWICDMCRTETDNQDLGRVIIYENMYDKDAIACIDVCQKCLKEVQAAIRKPVITK